MLLRLLLAALFVALATSKRDVKVQVYYETLCGDSRRFINNHLFPTVRNLGEDALDIELIPYGKATTKEEAGKYTFTCQHGPNECDGNKMHACALKYLSKSVGLAFVHCSMKSQYPPLSLTECAQPLNVAKEQINEITKCSESAEGEKLLAENGMKTHALEPKLFFVPWITINGVFDEKTLWESQKDFKQHLCDKLGNEFCSTPANNRGQRRV